MTERRKAAPLPDDRERAADAVDSSGRDESTPSDSSRRSSLGVSGFLADEIGALDSMRHGGGQDDAKADGSGKAAGGEGSETGASERRDDAGNGSSERGGSGA